MKQLRPYQQAAIDATVETLKSHGSTVVVLPTGCGKTVYAARLIRDWPGNTLFLAHTQELIYQSASKIEAEIGIRPHVEMAQHGADLDTLWSGDMCVVGSVQSMISERRLRKYDRTPFDLIVIDECHHATSASYRRVVEYFHNLNRHLKTVGITATPNRADGTALGLVFESVAYQMGITDAVEQGWLVPFRPFAVNVEGLDFSGIKVKKSKTGDADFSQEELEAVLTEEKNLHEMAGPILHECGNRPALVFTAGVRHAHLLADVLNRHRKGCAAAVDGTTDKEQRKEILRAFSTGKLQYLANCMVLTEGFDAPNCAAVVMGRPTKSLSLYTQMLGRGLRPLPGVVDGVPTDFDRRMAILTSEKSDCMVLDFVGAGAEGVVDGYDVLGGHYDAETRELARREQSKKPEDAGEQLALAQLLNQLAREWREREGIKANVIYSLEEGAGTQASYLQPDGVKRGGATDGQIGFLVKLGITRATAEAYTKKQAGAVIDKLSKERCTTGQAFLLRKHGLDPRQFNCDTAAKQLDAIKGRGR